LLLLTGYNNNKKYLHSDISHSSSDGTFMSTVSSDYNHHAVYFTLPYMLYDTIHTCIAPYMKVQRHWRKSIRRYNRLLPKIRRP